MERARKKLEREEPAQIEKVANEAVADVDVEPPVSIVPGSDPDEKVSVSSRELEKVSRDRC
jgi:hypothetical protein